MNESQDLHIEMSHYLENQYDLHIMTLCFPEDKKEIADLSYDKKMEWYATRDPQAIVWLGNSPEFQRFWKWHVVIPVKLRRFYYRVKNLEIFKHYKHITEMKKNVKKHSI